MLGGVFSVHSLLVSRLKFVYLFMFYRKKMVIWGHVMRGASWDTWDYRIFSLKGLIWEFGRRKHFYIYYFSLFIKL